MQEERKRGEREEESNWRSVNARVSLESILQVRKLPSFKILTEVEMAKREVE